MRRFMEIKFLMLQIFFGDRWFLMRRLMRRVFREAGRAPARPPGYLPQRCAPSAGGIP